MAHQARIAFCVLISISFGWATGAAAAVPQPPCAAAEFAAFSTPGADPAVTVWHQAELEKSKWQPPACTGWAPSSRSKLVVALAGSFRFAGSMDQLVTRVGAISALPGVQYWSTSDKAWRPLAYDASALSGPKKESRRPDFSAADLIKGADRYYWENDSRSGEIVYRLKVHEKTSDRAVIGSENATPVRRFFVTVFEPGSLQSVIFLQWRSPGIMGVYLLNRTGEGASLLAGSHDASYINRAVALFRHIAGIKTDSYPPAMR